MKLFPYKILIIDLKKVFLDGIMVLGLGPSVSHFESFYSERRWVLVIIVCSKVRQWFSNLT